MANRQKVTVEVEERSATGKNACRRMRREGKVPGNVYGLDGEPFAVAVNARRIDEVLHLETGRNTIFSLGLAGKDQRRDVMFREIQRDPVTEQFVHVDFLRIDPDQKIAFDVPVRIVGLAEGVKNEGGILDFVNRRVRMSCLPDRVPDHVDIDVSELHLGQHVSVKDLVVDDEIEILDDPESIVAVVSAPRVEVEAPAAGEEEEVALAEGEAEAADGEAAEGEAGEKTKETEKGDKKES